MRIAVLCNHPLGFPSIEYLLSKNCLVGLGSPQIVHDTAIRLEMIAEERKLPFVSVDPGDIAGSITAWLNKCKPDVVFVLTFPFVIPESVLKIPKLGFLNWHTGMLPKYRGPDPTFWQIYNQEQVGGVAVHKMDKNLDTGPVAYKEQVPITPEDTYGQHVQKLALAAAKATEYLLDKLIANPQELKFFQQDPSAAQYYGRPDFTNLLVSWREMPAGRIKALVRASNPIYGGAITFFRGVPVHLLQVSVGAAPSGTNDPPGTIVSSNGKDGILVMCKDQKLLRLDVLYTEDGFFTGAKLASIFNINKGEVFTDPPINPEAIASN